MTELPDQNYKDLADEQLALLSRGGDEEAERLLVLRMMPLVKKRIRPYFLIGADEEDLLQEGSIGLCSAIRDFDPERSVSFRAYADVCITNNIFAAIKRAARKKHIPLNTSVSLDKALDDNDEGAETFGSRLNASHDANPEELAIRRETEISFERRLLARLTELENSALTLFLDGKSYKQIAEELGKSPKAVDNALQRIKKKVAALLKEENE